MIESRDCAPRARVRLKQSFNVLRHNVHFTYCQSINLYFYTCQTSTDLKIKYIWNGLVIKGEMIYWRVGDSGGKLEKRTCLIGAPRSQ